MINPGTDDMPLTKASLDPNGWKVTLEADSKDKAGAAMHYVIEGKIRISSCRTARSSARGRAARQRRVRGEPAMSTSRTNAVLCAPRRRAALAGDARRGASPDRREIRRTKSHDARASLPVDWRNPHVHVFMNVTARRRISELGRRAREPRDCSSRAAGRPKSVQPGDEVTVGRHRRPRRHAPDLGRDALRAGDKRKV